MGNASINQQGNNDAKYQEGYGHHYCRSAQFDSDLVQPFNLICGILASVCFQFSKLIDYRFCGLFLFVVEPLARITVASV